MTDKIKNLREEIEKNGDEGGDLHLALAECLIATESYDEACENLLYCLDKDTAVRECAYPHIVDLLSMGKCIELVPHMTFEWLRLDAYIEDDKKKAMYMGIAFGTDNLRRIANALECYVIDFGGDENVAAMYDRLEDLTYEQMPGVDYYDYFYFDLAHEALCNAAEKGELDFARLSDARLMDICGYSEDYDVKLEITKYLLENRGSDELWKTVTSDYELGVALVGYFAEKKNYEALTRIYVGFKCDGEWDYNSINEEIYGPVIDCIIKSGDVAVLAEFINACDGYFGEIYSDYRYFICEAVSNNYLDEDGFFRVEWGDLSEVYTMLAELVFDTLGEAEVENTFGCFNKQFVKDAIEFCAHEFTDEALEDRFEEEDGEIRFSTIYGYTFLTQDKEGLKERIIETFEAIEKKYF